MAETLEEQMDREAPRVNAELARRAALPKIDTGVTLRAGGFYNDASGRKRGPVFEHVPGVWGDHDPTTSWHPNGIAFHSTAEDVRNLISETSE